MIIKTININEEKHSRPTLPQLINFIETYILLSTY